MAAGRETISLSFQAELGDLKRQLGQLDGITKKEAAQMVKDLNTGFKQAERAAARAAKANKRQFKQMADSAAMAGAAILGAAASVVALGQAFADLQNELADASARTGVAVDTLAGLRLAAEGSGLEFSKLEAGLGKLPKAMSDAARGAGPAARAFEKLGVDVETVEGNLRSSDEVLRETFEALAAIENQAEKAATTMDIFGLKAGPAFIQSGAIDNLDAFVQLATEFGVDVGPKAAASAAQFQRSIATLSTVSQGALFEFVDSLGGPGGVNEVFELAIRSVIIFGRVAGSVFDTLGEQVQSFAGPLAEVAYELSKGDIGGAFRALQRNQEEILNGALGMAPGVMPYRLLANAIEAAGEAADESTKAIGLLNETTSGGVQRARALPGEGADGATSAPTVAAGTEATDAAIRDLERLRAAQRKASEARLSERAKIELAYLRETEVIEAALEADAEREELQAAMSVADSERLIALAALDERLHQEKLERIKAAGEAARRENAAIAASTADALGALSDVAGAAALAMAEAGTEGSRKNAMTLFRVQKALAASMIPLRLAEGLLTAAAQPPPINSIQAATVVATAAAQGIAIASSKPPTFDRGGIVNAGTGDQIAAAVLPGEAILSREAVSNLGPGGVDALNSGRGAGGPMVVQMVYRHRVFDEFVQDNISAPSPLGAALRGDRVTGRRS
jgi:hypothetical protein